MSPLFAIPHLARVTTTPGTHQALAFPETRPIDDAGPRVVPQSRDIQFGTLDSSPDVEHVPLANIVKNDDDAVLEFEAFEASQDPAFKLTVLGCIHEYEVRGADQVRVALNILRVSQVGKDLRNTPI